jgi:hypothetical protein
MRAVALSDKTVQDKVARHFVPLKLTIMPGTKEFPLDWPALQGWKTSYGLMGGQKNEGFTGCSVVSPDLQVEYGNTGSAFVWEMFDSTAYDATKFAAMLDRANARWAREQPIRADTTLSRAERERQLASLRSQVREAVGNEGRFHLPPKGFTVQDAVELFELSGDLPKKETK